MREEHTQNHSKAAGIPAIEKAPERENYPVTMQQEGVWLQAKIDPASTVWNTSHSWRYEGRLEIAAMKEAIRQLIRRHAPLRTNFRLKGDQICQYLHDRYTIDDYYTYIDISGKPGEGKESEARRLEIEAAQEPYDLEKTPLARFTLIRFQEDDHLLVMGLHHIITDVTTRQILWKEMIALYNAKAFKKPEELEPIEIQYHDYAEWQQEFIKTPYYDRQREYWQGQLAGPLPGMSMPTEKPRGEETPTAGTGKLARYTKEMDLELAERLRTFGLQNRVSFSAVFLAAYYIFLSKQTGQQDMIIGSLYKGRNIHKEELNKIMGIFANFVALRLEYPGDITIKKLLKEVEKKTREAYENQEYQWEHLVRAMHPQRTAFQNSLFRVVFNMIKFTTLEMDPEGLKRKEWEPYKPDDDISTQYEMSLYVRDEFRRVSLRVLYTTDRYTQETIARMMERYTVILKEMMREPGEKLAGITILTEAEKRRLLVDFNETAEEYPKDKTIHRLIEEQVERTPDHIALVGVGLVGAVGQVQLTYRELNERSGQLAYQLIEKGVQSDTIVGIMMERSVEMMIGLMGILKAGGAYLPIDPGYPKERIDYMLNDSNAKLVISQKFFRGSRGAAPRRGGPISGDSMCWYEPNERKHSFVSGLPVPRAKKSHPGRRRHSLAYVIYTSGSTGRPKGVMIEHRAVHNFIRGIVGQIDFTPGKSILALTTISFDIFVLETLLPLARGVRVEVAGEVEQADIGLLEAFIVRQGVDMMQATPTRMRMFHRGGGDLGRSCLRHLKEIMVGGEAFPGGLLKELQRLETVRVYNMYGPTETTVWSTMKELTREKEITVGGPLANTQVYILDRNGGLQPEGVEGELCIGGDGLARGYLNRPELTAEKFCLRRPGGYFRENLYRHPAPRGLDPSKNFLLNHSPLTTHQSPIYQTGDLARWKPGGTLEILGREDNQVKIRGMRIEMGEIEAVLNEYPGIKESVVVAVGEAGEKSICAYLVEKPGEGEPGAKEAVTVERLREHLVRELPGYMVPAYFVKLDRMPLTANGKIDRKALPGPGGEAVIGTGAAYAAPGNRKEEILAAVWQEVLGVARVGIDDNFFVLGGDSIKAIRVASRLSAYGYRYEIGEILRQATIREEARYIGEPAGEPGKTDRTGHDDNEDRYKEVLDPHDIKTLKENFGEENIVGVYELSPMQEGMLYHYLADQRRQSYLVQVEYILEGEIEVGLFKESYERLMAGHEVYRTAIVYRNIKKPCQVVLRQREGEARWNDLTGGTGDPAAVVEEIKKQDREWGFDLQRETLLRYTLVKTRPGRYTLLVTFHHMIMDGWSTNLMMKEWLTLYGQLRKGTVKEDRERYTYGEYVRWIREQDMGASVDFWRGYLSGIEQATMIPPDRSETALEKVENKRQRYIAEIEKETIEGLTRLARGWKVTLNNIFQVVWGVILQRYTGGDDVVYGNVVSGRNIPKEGIDRVIGLFINTLPMRVNLERYRTIAEVAREIREDLIEIQRYGNLSLGEIRKYAEVGGPVLQHLYVYENYPVDREIRGAEQEEKIGFKIVGRNSEEHTDYPLDIMIIPREEFRICIQYNENVYTPSMVMRLEGHIKRLIGEVLREPGQRLGGLEIITPGEKRQILEEFNRAGVDYPKDKTIHGLFEEQVERTPDHIALVGVGLVGAVGPVGQVGHVRPAQPVQLTYREFNERTGRLARRLIGQGVQPETIVGIMVERSIEMVEGIMGILKAGGAYMPIDPGNPEERVNYMLADSQAKLLVVTNNLTREGEKVRRWEGEKVLLEGFLESLENSSYPLTFLPSYLQNSSNLSYVIYTSGSTGKPKGVMVSHGAVVNTLTALQERYPLKEGDGYLLKTSYVFDVSVAELYGWYMDRGGGRLVVLEQGGEKDPGKIIETVQRERVTHLNFVPTMFNVFIEALNPKNIKQLAGLKYIFLAGEALMPQMVEKFRALRAEIDLENLYGPTEAAVYASWYSLKQRKGGESIPIGRPLPNVKLYILDKEGQLQVVGVPGELSIVGAGLARGYLNRPELTTEKFCLRRPGGSFCKNRPLDPCKNFLLNHSTTHHSPLTIYKTGDLARWQPDPAARGAYIIEFLGRMDHQVKIRGNRIEMGEIEAQLHRHNKIKSSVVTVITDPEGGKSLCAYVVGEEALTVAQVREYLEKRLPVYMVPAYIVRLEQIPMTVSGKIDRKALPDPGKTVDGGAGYEPPEPGNDAQQKLVSVMQEVLGVERIGMNDNFFVLGGDSIKAIRVVSRIGVYGYRLDINDIFKKPVLKELWKEVGRAAQEIEQQAVTGIVPLTPIQAWYREQGFTQKQHWNMAVMVTRPGGYRPDLLQQVINRVMEHHDMLRAVLSPEETTMEIKRPGEIEVPVEVINLEKMEKGSRELEDRVREEAERIQAGIDLKRGPLIKVALLKTSGSDHLLIVIHHLVVDGISWRILLEDISRGNEQAGEGREIRYPAKTHSYKRWSEELATYSRTPRLLTEYSYWREICTAGGTPFWPLQQGTGGQEREKTKLADYIQSTLEMGEEETRLLLKDVHRAYHTEINDILLSALGLAVKESFGVKKVMIHLEGHGREKITRDLDITRTVGWYTSLYPVVLEVDEKEPGPADYGNEGENHPLAWQIRRCKENLRKIPHKGIGYGILRYQSPLPARDRQALEVRPGILFNYLGQFDEDLKAAGYEKSTYSTGRSRSPESEGTHAININGQVEGGKLKFTIRGDGRRVEEGQLRTLANSYKNNLQKIIAHCREVAEPGKTPSDYNAPGLDFEELAAIYRYYGKSNTGKIYNLSPMQGGMLYHYLKDPRHQAYQVQLVYILEGEIDPVLYRESCRREVERHDVLRTAILYKNVKRPRQVVLKERENPFSYYDIIGIADQAAWWEDYAKQDRQKGFELIDEPLIRWALIKTHQDRYTLLITFHHLILDGWSTNILMKESIDEYRRIKKNQPGQEGQPGEEKPYLDYIGWLEGQETGEAHRYWQEKLRGFDRVTRLPAGRQTHVSGKERPVNREYTTVIARDLYRRLEGVARQGNVTLNIVLQAVWSVIVHRYTGAGDILFGNVISGRNISLEGIDRIMGLFINTIPMRVQIEERQSFRRMAEGLQENLMESQKYGYLSLGEIQGYAAEEGPLLEHLYIYENYPVEQEMRSHRLAETAGFKITKRYSLENTGYPLNLMIIPREDMHLVIQYQEGEYDLGMVMGLARHIGCALEQVVLDPEQPAAQIEILTAEEKHRLMEEFNDTEAAYPRESTIHGLFEEQVERTPDHIALVGVGLVGAVRPVRQVGHVRPAQLVQLTYRELNERSGRLARRLIGQGVQPDTIVGIRMERSVEMIIGIFGILKAGGAYMPIDPEYPGERVNYMLADSGAKLLVVTNNLTQEGEKVGRWEGEKIFIEEEIPGFLKNSTYPLTFLPSHLQSSSNLAYVIYTSGSTGKPKGVMITHRSAVNYLWWAARIYVKKESVNFPLFTSISFDLTVTSIFIPLVTGNAVVVYCQQGGMENIIERIMEDIRVGVIKLTPSHLSLIQPKKLKSKSLTSTIKRFVLGGEQLETQLARDIYENFPGDIEIYNEYGPTEATVGCMIYRYDIEKDSGVSIPIGIPAANARVYVMDQSRKLLPQGIPGEIYIAGVALARGYLNRPALTEEKFIRSYYRSNRSHRSYIKLYKTGDLARWQPDGNIEFLGRIDHQVKIRGYRIELGEIESRLHRHPGIKEAVVTVTADESGGQNLCAYIVSELTLTTTQLREYLAGHLPGYMIPAYFVKIDKIPLTTNGKVDRKSLPGPGKRLAVKTEYAAPTDEIEAELVKIWQELLKIPRIGIHDNFIELGGHSLLVMNMVIKIETRFGIEIPLGDIFDRPTIAQIARQIHRREEKIRKLDRVLTEIEAMSEEQVRELLHYST